MTITIHPEHEMRFRARAEAEGLTVEAYVERLLLADQQALDELEALAFEGLESDGPIQVGPGYWEEMHRRVEERLKNSAAR